MPKLDWSPKPKFQPRNVWRWVITVEVLQQFLRLTEAAKLWDEDSDEYRAILEDIRRLPGFPNPTADLTHDLIEMVLSPSSRLISVPTGSRLVQ